MEIKVSIKPRNGNCHAEAIYDGNQMTVLNGIISSEFAAHVPGGKQSKAYRNNLEYVDKDRKIIKPCVFSSPSTAAQFVTGRSVNGYEAWKVEPKKNLGVYLKENGLR